MSYFTWPGVGYSKPLDLSDLTASRGMAQGAARNVQKRREAGTDNTTFKGMSKRSSEMSKKQLPPAMMKAKKKEAT